MEPVVEKPPAGFVDGVYGKILRMGFTEVAAASRKMWREMVGKSGPGAPENASNIVCRWGSIRQVFLHIYEIDIYKSRHSALLAKLVLWGLLGRPR